MGMDCNSDLACCRAMLAPRLCESAACTHELAWYGVTPEQKDAFGTRFPPPLRPHAPIPKPDTRTMSRPTHPLTRACSHPASTARTGVSLRNLVGVPCLEPPNSANTAMPASPSICAVLVLYTRMELPQCEAYNMLLHALGSAAAAAYALGLNKPRQTDAPAPNYTSVPTDGPATSLSWLLLAAARALQVDIAEHWTARQVSASRGGGVYMAAEQLLVSQRVHNLPDTVLVTGERAEAMHPFSSHMSRATLYAGKLVWCNGTSASGALEGVKLPVQTAVGLPLRSHVGGGAAFVLYSMRRLEQSTSVTYFIAQLQVLAAASHAASSQTPSIDGLSSKTSEAGLDSNASDALPEPPQLFAPEDPASGAPSSSAPSAAPSLETLGGGGGDMWVTPEAVMSTEQVLSLIDCLGDKYTSTTPLPSLPPSQHASRRGSALAFDALVGSCSPPPVDGTAVARTLQASTSMQPFMSVAMPVAMPASVSTAMPLAPVPLTAMPAMPAMPAVPAMMTTPVAAAVSTALPTAPVTAL